MSEVSADDWLTDYLAQKGLAGPVWDGPAPSADAARGRGWLERLQVIYGHFLDEVSPARPTTFTWIEDRSLNAFADTWRGRSVVGINLGAAEVLIDFFSAALSSARILPQIGNTEVEEYFWDELEIDPGGVPAPSGAVPRRTPRDPDRRRWAFLLTQLALEFTVLHELSHIVAGHLLFKRARLGLRSPTRARPVSPRPSRSLETQRLLELDADAYALNLFTTNLLGRRVSATPIPAGGSDQELYLMTSLALNAYFALTSPEAFGVDYTAKTHPDPSLRLLFAVDIVEPLLPARKASAFRDAYFSAFEVMHDVWEELGVAQQHSSRSYLSFMGKATGLDDERLWLAGQHQEILNLLSPFDMRD